MASKNRIMLSMDIDPESISGIPKKLVAMLNGRNKDLAQFALDAGDRIARGIAEGINRGLPSSKGLAESLIKKLRELKDEAQKAFDVVDKPKSGANTEKRAAAMTKLMEASDKLRNAELTLGRAYDVVETREKKAIDGSIARHKKRVKEAEDAAARVSRAAKAEADAVQAGHDRKTKALYKEMADSKRKRDQEARDQRRLGADMHASAERRYRDQYALGSSLYGGIERERREQEALRAEARARIARERRAEERLAASWNNEIQGNRRALGLSTARVDAPSRITGGAAVARGFGSMVGSAVSNVAAYSLAGAAFYPAYAASEYYGRGREREQSIMRSYSIADREGKGGMFSSFGETADAIHRVSQQTGLAGKQIDDLALAIAQAGINSGDTENIMREMGKAIKLSFGELDPKLAIQGFNTLRNTFFKDISSDAERYSRALDGINKSIALANVTSSDPRQIIEAMARVGGGASMAGFSYDRLAALLVGAQERSGVSAVSMATTMRRTLPRLVAPETLSKLASAGVETRDFSGGFLSQEKIFGNLAKKYQELDAAGRKHEATQLAIAAAGTIQYSNLSQLLLAYNDIDATLGKVSSASAKNSAEMEMANDTLAAAYIRLENSLEMVGTALVRNTTAGSGLKDVLNALSSATDSLGFDSVASSVEMGVSAMSALALQSALATTALGAMAGPLATIVALFAGLKGLESIYGALSEMAALSEDVNFQRTLENKVGNPDATKKRLALLNEAGATSTMDKRLQDAYNDLASGNPKQMNQAGVAIISAAMEKRSGLFGNTDNPKEGYREIESMLKTWQTSISTEERKEILSHVITVLTERDNKGRVKDFLGTFALEGVRSQEQQNSDAERRLLLGKKMDASGRAKIDEGKMLPAQFYDKRLAEISSLQDEYTKIIVEYAETRNADLLEAMKTHAGRAKEIFKEISDYEGEDKLTRSRSNKENASFGKIEVIQRQMRLESASSLRSANSRADAAGDRLKAELDMAIKGFEKLSEKINGKAILSKVATLESTIYDMVFGMKGIDWTGGVRGEQGKDMAQARAGLAAAAINQMHGIGMSGLMGDQFLGTPSKNAKGILAQDDSTQEKMLELEKVQDDRNRKDAEAFKNHLAMIEKYTNETAKKLTPFQQKLGGAFSKMMSGGEVNWSDFGSEVLGGFFNSPGNNLANLIKPKVDGQEVDLMDLAGFLSGKGMIGVEDLGVYRGRASDGVQTAFGAMGAAGGLGSSASSIAGVLGKTMKSSATSSITKDILSKSTLETMSFVGDMVSYYGYIKAAGAILKSAGIGTDRTRQDDRSTVDGQNTLISDLFNNLKGRGTNMTAEDIASAYGYVPSYSTAVKTTSRRGGLHGLLGGKDTSYTNNNAGAKSIDELYKMTYDSIIRAGQIELELRDDEVGQLSEKLSRTEMMIEMNKKTNGKLDELAESEVSAMNLRQQIYDTIMSGYQQVMGFSSSQATMQSYAKKYGLASPITNKNFGAIQSYTQTSVVSRINDLASKIVTKPSPFGSSIAESIGDQYASSILGSFERKSVNGAAGSVLTADPLGLGRTMDGLSILVDKFNQGVSTGTIEKDSPTYNALLEMVNLTTDLVSIQRAALENMIEENRKKIEYSDYLSASESAGESMKALESSTGMSYSDFVKKMSSYAVGGSQIGGLGDLLNHPDPQIRALGARSGLSGSKYKYREQAINERVTDILGYSNGTFGTGSDILSNLYNTDWLNKGLSSLDATADDTLMTEVKLLFSELQSAMSGLMGTFSSDKSSSSAKNEESKMYEVNSTGKYYITQNFSVESTYFGGSKAEAVQFLKFLSTSWNDSGLKNSGSKLF